MRFQEINTSMHLSIESRSYATAVTGKDFCLHIGSMAGMIIFRVIGVRMHPREYQHTVLPKFLYRAAR